MSENKTIIKKFFGWGKQVDGDKKVDEFIYNEDDSTVVVDGDDSNLHSDDLSGNQPENPVEQQNEIDVISSSSSFRKFVDTNAPQNHWSNPKNNITDLELTEDEILEKIAKEFCVNHDFLNKLGSEIANCLAEKLLNQVIEPIDAQFESAYTNRAHDFIKHILPQIESEFKRFVTEVQHVKE